MWWSVFYHFLAQRKEYEQYFDGNKSFARKEISVRFFPSRFLLCAKLSNKSLCLFLRVSLFLLRSFVRLLFFRKCWKASASLPIFNAYEETLIIFGFSFSSCCRSSVPSGREEKQICLNMENRRRFRLSWSPKLSNNWKLNQNELVFRLMNLFYFLALEMW
jgi:hypothetical protein